MTELVKIERKRTTYYARPKMAAPKTCDPEHPQWKRRRRRNDVLAYFGLAMIVASMAGGFLSVSNTVLVTGLVVGALMAIAGFGLHTWTGVARFLGKMNPLGK